MTFLRKMWGFTRLESLLAALLMVSIGLVIWAVLPSRDAVDHDAEISGPVADGKMLDDDSMLLSILGDSHELTEHENGEIPSLKGKTNMPAPSKVTGSAKKPAKKPVKKPVAGKAAPPRITKKPGAQKKPVAKTVKAPAKRAVPAAQLKRKIKIPGVKSALIDVPPPVMAMLEELEDAQWSREVEKKLVGAVRRWAQIDLEGAADFALDIERRGTRNAALSQTLTSWLADSPQAAQAWFISAAEADPFLLGDLTSQFYNKLSVKATADAMEGLWALPTAGMKRAALQQVSQRLIHLNREQEVLDMYGTAEAAEDRNIVIDVIMQRMARYEPDELGSWVFTLPDDGQRRRALNQFVGAWSRDYPSAAAEWVVAEVPEDEGRAQQISTVVGNWVKEDPVEAAEWLLGLFPASRETDPAVDRFARAVLTQDPAYAAAWSFSVVDNNQRWRLMEQIAVNWKRKDPAAAREYIEQTDLPANTKNRLNR